MEKQKHEAIPQEEYFKILSLVPIFCVDNIAYRVKNGKPEVLLLKRKQHPAQGCLYPIGKGLKKNMFSTEGALYALEREIGVKGILIRAFGIYEGLYAQGQSPEVKNGLHNPCIAYLTKLPDNFEITLDANSSGCRWVTQADIVKGLRLPPYTRTLLEDSGIFTQKIDKLKKSTQFHHRLLDYRETDFSKFMID